MQHQTHPSRIKIIEPFLTLLIIGAIIVYALNALNTGNWLWFRGTAVNDIHPNRIVIVDHGQRTTLQPGHADFDMLADAASSSLSKLGNTDLVAIGLSEQTLADYATDSVVLELYFAQPVTFNSLARTGKPTQLLIPIAGRHANGDYVFRGDRGEWWFGAVRMADSAPLFSALSQMGLIVSQPQPSS